MFHYNLCLLSVAIFSFHYFVDFSQYVLLLYMWLLKRYNNEPTERKENQQKKETHGLCINLADKTKSQNDKIEPDPNCDFIFNVHTKLNVAQKPMTQCV